MKLQVEREIGTTTVRNNSLAPDFLNPKLLDQPKNSMIGTSGFESADPLVILAFEVEVQLGVGAASLTGCRSDVAEGLACQQGGAVDVWLDKVVSGADIIW